MTRNTDYVKLTDADERAVLVVFDACRATGTSLAFAHRVAAMVGEQLERLRTERER